MQKFGALHWPEIQCKCHKDRILKEENLKTIVTQKMKRNEIPNFERHQFSGILLILMMF